MSHDIGGALELVLRDLEEKLVVDLEEHARPEAARLQLLLDPDHRELDDVRRAPLDRAVPGHSLGCLPEMRSTGVQVRQRPATPGHRADVAERPPLFHDALRECLHTRIAFEVAADHLLGFGERNRELSREPLWAHPVEDAEVDDLRAPALILGDGVGGTAKTSAAVGGGCPRLGRRRRRVRDLPSSARGGGARSASSRRRARSSPEKRRTRRGCAAPRRSGSGCSADSARSTRDARSRRRSG
jgi:hypothetical protein